MKLDGKQALFIHVITAVSKQCSVRRSKMPRCYRKLITDTNHCVLKQSHHSNLSTIKIFLLI